jgi:8-oxo-dGTP pyrophosphatase MutT (NUDIX family)
MKEYYCANCGKTGHIYKNCLFPIISLGIILFKKNNNNEIEYLMVQRKDTLGFVEFMRGKYNIENVEYIEKLISIMTYNERQKIIENDFDDLWNELWMDKTKKQYFNEYENSKKKFYSLKMGFIHNETFVDIHELNKKANILYYSPEWGFPKGRRNLHEIDLECANREFKEETGLKDTDYVIVSDKYYCETFFGTNNIRYKHIYYLATLNTDTEIELKIDESNVDQVTEISNISWYEYKSALNIIRPYNLEKKEILKIVNKVIGKYYI